MPMHAERKKTRRIYVGHVPIGGGAPIAVQSMTNTDTQNVSSKVEKINRLKPQLFKEFAIGNKSCELRL